SASMLDEATAAAEAMTLMRRSSRAGESAVLVVDRDVFPQTLAVVQTRAEPLGLRVVVADLSEAVDAGAAGELLTAAAGEDGVFGVLVQYPSGTGAVRDLTPLAEAAHAAGALLTVAADLLALTLLRAPGEMGAD